LFNKIQLGEAV